MREGLRCAVSATPLLHVTAEWPEWTAEVLTYVAVFGRGFPKVSSERMDQADCCRVAAVLLHKHALADAAAAQGLLAADTRPRIPKCVTSHERVCL
jgi:hypothetical protein